MVLISRTTWESDIFRLSIFYFNHFFDFLDFLDKFQFLFLVSFSCLLFSLLMKPLQNQITISPPDLESKQPCSFLRNNKVQASKQQAQLVSFKIALKTCYARLRCVFSVCEFNNYEPYCNQCNNKPTKMRQNRSNHNNTDDRPHDPSSCPHDNPIPNKISHSSS